MEKTTTYEEKERRKIVEVGCVDEDEGYTVGKEGLMEKKENIYKEREVCVWLGSRNNSSQKKGRQCLKKKGQRVKKEQPIE